MTDELSPPLKSVHLLIHGRVQGVFFRDSMRREARALPVAGWVRNLGDGTVEAVVQGEPSAVDALVRWAHHGPQHARVDRVEIGQDSGSYVDFEVVG